MARQLICAIIGSKAKGAKWNKSVESDAVLAGRTAASLGYAVLTGGLSGVMEYAALGAKEADGLTIGILPGEEHRDANPFIDIVLPTGIGIVRNALTARAADIVVALPGGHGTLEEMAFALDFNRPVLSWNSWALEGAIIVTDREQLKQELENFINHAR